MMSTIRKILILALSCISLQLVAQVPNWYDATSRSIHYPRDIWFIGFVEGEKQIGESTEEAILRIKNEARVELASTIKTSVQQTIESSSQSVLQQSSTDFEDNITEVFLSTTRIKTGAEEIFGMQVESYQHKSNGVIAAFAFVKKTTLSRQLRKRIMMELGKIESDMDQIQHWISNDEKIQARDLAQRTNKKFSYVETLQELLLAVDENADEEDLQTLECKALKQQVDAIITELKNGINIYLSCNATLFGNKYDSFKSQLQGSLSDIGCTFVQDSTQSDWTIYVTSITRKYNIASIGNTKQYYAYVDANIIVEKFSSGKRTYEDSFSQKGGHTLNYELAAREAYQNILPIISSIIKKQILP